MSSIDSAAMVLQVEMLRGRAGPFARPAMGRDVQRLAPETFVRADGIAKLVRSKSAHYRFQM